MVTPAVTTKKQRSQVENGLLPGDKWCPMARIAVAGDDQAIGNRFPAGVGLSDYWRDVRCLGTACAVFVGAAATGHCGLIRG